jgi:outer membrane protein assembly factor BamB
VNERVYVGSGVDRNRPESPGETAFFCLDAHTGKELWKVAVDLPVWAGATVHGDHVFVALGNGDIFNEADTPRGAVLCLDAKTGKEVWSYRLGHGVLERPAVDEDSVYVGCRNNHVYCLKRVEGTRRWKTDLGSPVVASPALAQWGGHTDSIIAVASKGKVCSLDPATGAIQWTYNLSERRPHLSSSPRVVMTRTSEGDRRQIYFGAGLNITSILDVAAGKAVVYCLEDKLRD